MTYERNVLAFSSAVFVGIGAFVFQYKSDGIYGIMFLLVLLLWIDELTEKEG